MIRGGFNCGENNTVVFSGDWHIGNKYADKKGLQKMINTIKKEGSHLVIMGDIWDSITAKDKRHDGGMCDPLFVGSDPIYNAFEWVQDLLKPIKSQIMYIHTGNHEHTITKCCEIDLAKMLAKNLNVRYADYASHMRYTFKKSTNSQSYVIYTTHGFVSGRKRGGKVNSLEDTAAFMDFDLMAAGHSHDLFFTSQEKLYLSRQTNEEEVKTIFFCNTGSFLPGIVNGPGTPYAEMKGFRKLKCGYIKATFGCREKCIKVEEVTA